MKHLLHSYSYSRQNRFLSWMRVGQRLTLLCILGVLGASSSYAALSGTYTIDPAGAATAGNYKTFASAVSDLISGTRADGGPANGAGVTGPVTFNVASGTYVESLIITAISGASPTNRITFQSNTGNYADVWLGDNVANVAIVTLKNASYITFQNMTVRKQTRSTGNSRAFELQATGTGAGQKCSGIRVIGCYMETQWSGSTATNYCVMSTGDNDSLKLKRNTISNTCGLLYHQGNSGLYTKGIEIDSNIMNSSVSALWWSIGQIAYVDAIKIRYNDILNNNFGGGGTGGPGVLDITNVSNEMVIAYNRSQQSDATWSYSLRNININGETTPALIYNNFIHHQGPNSQAALYITSSSYVNIYHNNIFGNGGSTSALRVDGADTRFKIRIANNHLYSAGIYPINLTGSLVTFDYVNGNNYWNNGGGDIASYGGINYVSLVPMRGKIHTTPWANDRNSFNINPIYTLSNNYDLRIGVTCVNGEFLGITDDFFRQPNNGAIGAHQPVQSSNDIGPDVLLYPNYPVSAGTQDVRVRIRNFGVNPITSANISYSLNGASAVTVSLPSTLNSCDTTSILLSSVTLTTGKNTLKIWTSLPNGGADGKIANDTLNIAMCTPLSGTYTINSASPTAGTNFQNFTDAVNQLGCGGISGPVTFNVQPGTYTEQVTVRPVPGSSSTNNIRFIGTDSTTCILQYAGIANARTTLLFNGGAKHYQFSKLNIKATNGTYGVGVGFRPGSDSNSVRNCIIDITGVTSGNCMGILYSPDGQQTSQGGASNYTTIDNNTINGGYYGIYYYGNNGTAATASKGNKFTRNRFNNTYYYGALMQFTDAYELTDNTFNMNTANANSYGIYVYFYFSSVDVSRNWVRAGYMPVYWYNPNNSGLRSKLNNNILVTNSTNTGSACVNVASYVLDIYHNTMLHSGTNGSALRFQYMTTAMLGYNIANNIIYASSGAYAVEMNNWMNANPGVSAWDWDNIYSGTANYCYYRNANGSVITNYSSVGDLRGAYPSFFTNTINEPVNFTSLLDGHLSPLFQSARGLTIPGINTDVDGQARCPLTPSLGADESSYLDNTFTAGFLVPDTLYTNAPVNIFNKFNPSMPIRHQWDVSINGSVDYTTANIILNYSSPGTDSIKLSSSTCSGQGSVQKSFVILNPTRAPEADFVANTYSTVKGGIVDFTNLSKYGATRFKWLVSPATGVNFLPNDTSFNTQIEFNTPGIYDVCLVATNALGADTICKSAYIDVQEEVYMCFDYESSIEKGNMYDIGGKNGVYSKGGTNTKSKCSFLINPCASSVSFTFNMFLLNAINSGGSLGMDSVRLFDGESNTDRMIGGFSQFNPPVIGTAYVANSGKMLVEFTIVNNSNGATAPGFDAMWTSVPSIDPMPIVNLEGFDTAYTGVDYYVRAKSNRSNLLYNVDMDSDPFYLEYEQEPDSTFIYTYYSPGTYEITVTALGCGGPVEIKKTIEVVDPSGPPRVDFYADKLKVSVNEVVSLFDQTKEGPFEWNWSISPGTFDFYTGSNANSKDPKVTFRAPGKYTVKLIARNTNGPAPNDTASLTKVEYIEVIDYCTPVAVNPNADMGISRVKLANLDNPSGIGFDPYTNYSNVAGKQADLDLGHIYTIELERVTTVNPMNRKVWIDYNLDGTFDPVTELVASEAASTNKTFSASFRVPVGAAAGISRMRIGTSYSNDANEPCGPVLYGEYEDYKVVLHQVMDTRKPVITMFGSDTTIEVGSAYTDAGVLADDDIDGNITGSVTISSNLDNTVLGTYTVVYKVSDAAGNAADSVIRYVTVVDTQAPVVTITGNLVDSVPVFGTWTDLGATVTDNYDAGLSYSVSGSPNTNVVDTYLVKYLAVDNSGNAATVVTRKVVVYDDIAPVITRNGADTIVLDVFGTYQDTGIIVTDNYYTGLSATRSGTLNTSQLGLYEITYTVTDPSGNNAVVKKRWVRVVDRVAPVITLKGLPFLNHQQFVPYVDSGAVVVDNYDGTITPTMTSDVDYTVEGGPYLITYSAMDASGNKAADVVRVVYVRNYAGLVEADIKDGMSLFPNPTSGDVKIYLVNSAAATVKVMTNLGQTLNVPVQQLANQLYTVDLSTLAAGNYLIQVTQGEATFTKQVNVIR